MKYNVTLSQEAQIELHLAVCFFKAQQSNLEIEFLEDFRKSIDFLRSSPESFQARYRKVRTIQFEKFKYSIHFVLDKTEVKILRILHQKQSF